MLREAGSHGSLWATYWPIAETILEWIGVLLATVGGWFLARYRVAEATDHATATKAVATPLIERAVQPIDSRLAMVEKHVGDLQRRTSNVEGTLEDYESHKERVEKTLDQLRADARDTLKVSERTAGMVQLLVNRDNERRAF